MRPLTRVDAGALRGADVVAGFPGPGLVGGIVVETLLEELVLPAVGSIGGGGLPAQALVEDGRPFWPILLFARPGLAVVKAEVDLEGEAAHVVGRSLAQLLRGAEARSLTLVDGLVHTAGEDGAVWAASSDDALREAYARAGAQGLPDGGFGGGTATALLWAEEAGIPAGVLAAPARPNLPDPRAASRIVAVLARMLSLDIDGGGLLRRGEELEAAFLRLLDEASGHGADAPRDAMYT